MAKVTNQEIARRAGVSPAAVSMAIHGKKGISEETRSRILQIVQELEYTPAARVRIDTENAVVLLSDTMSEPLAPFVVQGLIAYAQQQNVELRLLTLAKVLENPTACLSGCGLLVTFDQVERNLLNRLASMTPHILVIDGNFARKPFWNIRVDYAGAAYKLTGYLADRGHRSFVYLNQDLTPSRNLVCFSGFQRLILEQNLLLNPKQIIMDSASDPNVWSHFPDIIRSSNSSAVICTSEAAAFKATNMLINAGFRVPKDVSVAMISHSEVGEYPNFSFTHISMGLERIAEEIAKAAAGVRLSPQGADVVLEPLEVVPGESSGFPKYNPARKKLAIALYLKDHPTMRLVRAGFLNKVYQLGYQAEVVGTTKDDSESYIQSCRQLIEMKPDGVALWLSEPEVVDMLRQAGIPVVTLHNADNPNDKRIACNIAANPLSIAQNVAEFLAPRLQGRSGVVVVSQSGDNVLESGITEEFTKQMHRLCPQIRVESGMYFFRHLEQNTNMVAQYIRGMPDLLAAFSTAGDTCSTWADAKKLVGRQDLIVVGTDYTEETVELLENGEIQAFVAQPVYEEAQMSVEAMDAILRGNGYPVRCQLDAPLITRGNVEKYRRLLRDVQNWYV